MASITIKNLYKHFPPSFALQIDELMIEEGEFFGIIGPSGCGKTTLLRLITGLTAPDGGEIWLNGREITKTPPEKRNIGLIFQEPRLFPHFTVEENVGFGLKMKKSRRRDIKAKIDETLGIVGLTGFNRRYPSSLSGGQKQRVALARALVLEPKALLLDEPFSALDPELRVEMRSLIKKLQQEKKITIIFITHDREEAFTLFERMAVMQEGKILQTGTPLHIYNRPQNIKVANFLGINNILPGYIEGKYFYTQGLRILLGTAGQNQTAKYLLLKPESLKIINGEENALPFLTGNIEEITFQAGFYHIKVKVQSQSLNIIQKYQPGKHFTPGAEFKILYHPEEIILL